MKLAIPKERRLHERRVAASPDTVKKLVGLGFEVVVETGAGLGSSLPDSYYTDAGASIGGSAAETLAGADLVFRVSPPLHNQPDADGTNQDEISALPDGTTLVSMLNPFQNKELLEALAKKNITAFAMEMIPRISRSQSMDALSSQANLAGYKAVLEAANEFGRAFPMMMTAAGSIPPAKVLILGVGVAGLQAIATAKRLGARVSGYDVRPAVKDQVKSLGADFIEVDPEALKDAETEGGYAKEMSEDYKKKQAEVLAKAVADSDIAICTAQIPGRQAPMLINKAMAETMRPGSVIVDLAVESGGNCEVSELGKVADHNGVKIVGFANMPSRIAVDAGRLYAKNLLNFVSPMVDKDSGSLKIDREDDVVKGALVVADGAIVHPMLTGEGK